MADCGVNGTAIDRAVQSVLGSHHSASGNSGMQAKLATAAAKSLLGHATHQRHNARQSPGAAALPSAPPSQLTLPSSSARTANNGFHLEPPATQRSMVVTQPQHHQQQQQLSSLAVGATGWQKDPPSAASRMENNMMMQQQQHYHPNQMMVQDHYAQQMVMMQSMMMQQQQQLAHMVQQNQQQQQQQQRKIQQQQQLTSSFHENVESPPLTTNTSTSFRDDVLDEEQLKEEMRRHLEGLAQQQKLWQPQQTNMQDISDGYGGGSIDQLAAAWAEAEAEYANELLWNDDGANFLLPQESVARAAADGLHQYQFVNQVLSDQDQLQQQHQQQDSPDLDWMEQGMKHFQAGDIRDAIRAFEYELQVRNSNSAKAWRMLGRCHAENDQDREAILCFEHAVDRDPYSCEAMLDLGVSYVNELNHEKALEALLSWVTHNPKYSGMDFMTPGGGEDLYGGKSGESASVLNPTEATTSSAAFEQVQKLLLGALEYDPTSAEVMETLGVVYNVSGDYNAAVDMFEKALQTNQANHHDKYHDVQNNYQLWNKLGATLANSHRSEQALPAYHRALQLKPKYARGWLNLAISHSNLHHYAEAARCYLQTLSLNPAAVHCWSYLRIALTCDEKFDLLPLVAEQNLAAFQEHFDFVIYPSTDSK